MEKRNLKCQNIQPDDILIHQVKRVDFRAIFSACKGAPSFDLFGNKIAKFCFM